MSFESGRGDECPQGHGPLWFNSPTTQRCMNPHHDGNRNYPRVGSSRSGQEAARPPAARRLSASSPGRPSREPARSVRANGGG